MKRCTRCSYCKWIPLARVKSQRFARGCPSMEYHNFQSYSACGKIALALSMLYGRVDYDGSDKIEDIVYKCMLDGLCDVSCKVCRYNMEPLEILHELRFKLVEDGKLLPAHTRLIESLHQENNIVAGSKIERADWARDLEIKNLIKEKAGVVFHAGCNLSFDKELGKVARTAITILKNAGVDVGVMGTEEICCGGRIYDMGYREEFVKCAKQNIEAFNNAGVKTIVTSCSDCYHAFKRLYPTLGSGFEVLHTVEFVNQLIEKGKILFHKTIPAKVTYHDPCHLGRRGEPYVPWKGKTKKIRQQIVVYEPPKPRYSGALGIYDAPREVLKSIPGLDLVEMERTREYAWCCGAGGGVRESFPDFSAWSAEERINEARASGARLLVTACPWCERNFIDAVKRKSDPLKVYDILELVKEAM